MLDERLSSVEGIVTPKIAEGMNHVYHQYTILVGDEYGKTRDELSQQLQERGIGTGIYYPKTMADHETYKGHPRIDNSTPTPISDNITKRALSLPVHTKLTEEDIDYIAANIRDLRG